MLGGFDLREIDPAGTGKGDAGRCRLLAGGPTPAWRARREAFPYIGQRPLDHLDRWGHHGVLDPLGAPTAGSRVSMASAKVWWSSGSGAARVQSVRPSS